MNHIVFLHHANGRLAYTGYIALAVDRLRQDGWRGGYERELLGQIQKAGTVRGYRASVVSAPLALAA